MNPRTILAFIALLTAGACTTVHQSAVTSTTASWDGNTQNSGVVEERPDGYIVTPHFRDRYNALVATYGKSKLADGTPIFTPHLEKDAGLTQWADNFLMTREAMANMVVLTDLKRRGAPP